MSDSQTLLPWVIYKAALIMSKLLILPLLADTCEKQPKGGSVITI